jgi:hypothetical protein
VTGRVSGLGRGRWDALPPTTLRVPHLDLCHTTINDVQAIEKAALYAASKGDLMSLTKLLGEDPTLLNRKNEVRTSRARWPLRAGHHHVVAANNWQGGLERYLGNDNLIFLQLLTELHGYPETKTRLANCSHR